MGLDKMISSDSDSSSASQRADEALNPRPSKRLRDIIEIETVAEFEKLYEERDFDQAGPTINNYDFIFDK